jgi:glutamate synthase (ferredoxin)
MTISGYPPKQGLYDPRFEHDACGIGFVVNIKGEKSHEIVQQALTVLQNLDHRGACGCEDNTGDGAGILLQVPHKFLQHACNGIGLQLPRPRHYGVGMVFLPPDREQRHRCERRFEDIVRQAGQEVIGWRSVPTDNLYLGETAKSREPSIRQVFIKRNPDLTDDLAFERKLYLFAGRLRTLSAMQMFLVVTISISLVCLTKP